MGIRGIFCIILRIKVFIFWVLGFVLEFGKLRLIKWNKVEDGIVFRKFGCKRGGSWFLNKSEGK